eukprot:scaffold3944_cov361-Prasinococcus_capsulatus_cf.AAC.3
MRGPWPVAWGLTAEVGGGWRGGLEGVELRHHMCVSGGWARLQSDRGRGAMAARGDEKQACSRREAISSRVEVSIARPSFRWRASARIGRSGPCG